MRVKRKIAKPELKPEFAWDRQIGEPDASWAQFVVYRDMGPMERTLTKAARSVGKAPHTLEMMSQRWEWVARCAAYDAWVDRKKREADMAAIVEMRKRHTEMGMAFQGAAALALNKIVAAERQPLRDANGKVVHDKDGKPIPGPVTLKPSEVRDLAELGTKLERLSRGEPEAIVDNRITPMPAASPVTHDYSHLTLEELKLLRGLTDKARRELPKPDAKTKA